MFSKKNILVGVGVGLAILLMLFMLSPPLEPTPHKNARTGNDQPAQPTRASLVKEMNKDPSLPYMGTFVYQDIAIDGQPIGRIISGLYTETSPITAENFRSLCVGSRGPLLTYKGTRFHRIIPNFIVQGGGLEQLSRTEQHALKFNDEPTALALKHDARYILQMANSGPDTNGSQFCYMLKASPHLNGKHAVFGRVVSGFEVVDRMEMAGTKSGAPTEEVVVVDSGEIL